MGHHWSTQEEKEEVLKLRAEGLTYQEISDRTGKSITTVCKIVTQKNGAQREKKVPFHLRYLR